MLRTLSPLMLIFAGVMTLTALVYFIIATPGEEDHARVRSLCRMQARGVAELSVCEQVRAKRDRYADAIGGAALTQAVVFGMFYGLGMAAQETLRRLDQQRRLLEVLADQMRHVEQARRPASTLAVERNSEAATHAPSDAETALALQIMKDWEVAGLQPDFAAARRVAQQRIAAEAAQAETQGARADREAKLVALLLAEAQSSGQALTQADALTEARRRLS